jgi:hypothetical protein
MGHENTHRVTSLFSKSNLFFYVVMLYKTGRRKSTISFSPQPSHLFQKQQNSIFDTFNLTKMQFTTLIMALGLSSAVLGAALDNLTPGLKIRAADAAVATSLTVAQSAVNVEKRDLEKYIHQPRPSYSADILTRCDQARFRSHFRVHRP